MKLKQWWQAHKPSKRRIIQLYAALLFNANLKGFKTGKIYKGDFKNICAPGINCYSCPGAVGACPLGALQNALTESGNKLPFYMVGIVLLYGLLFARWICGFLCPFGLIQDLLHKIKTPKLKKSRVTRVLSYFKYVLLGFLVIGVPLIYLGFAMPGFCKYICPAGMLEGAFGLLSNPDNAGMMAMLGPLFTWKFLLLVGFIAGSIFIYRFFCRFFCPLGALYGLFNKIAFIGVKLDRDACTDCGLCAGTCKMDIRHVGDHECIQCGECIDVCPTGAIQWKGPKILLPPQAIGGEIPTRGAGAAATPMTDVADEASLAAEAAEAEFRRKTRRYKIARGVVAVVMVGVLAGALYYFNFVDGREKPVQPQPPAETSSPTDTADPADTSNGAETGEPSRPLPPVGNAVGNLIPDVTLSTYNTTGDFKLSDHRYYGHLLSYLGDPRFLCVSRCVVCKRRKSRI